MIEYGTSMKQAKIILAMLEADQRIDRECLEPNVKKFASVYVQAFSNGREQGYALYVTDGLGTQSKLITFSQHKVSDDFVVRVGGFDFQYTDEWYKNCKEFFFAWKDYQGTVDLICREIREIVMEKEDI